MQIFCSCAVCMSLIYQIMENSNAWLRVLSHLKNQPSAKELCKFSVVLGLSRMWLEGMLPYFSHHYCSCSNGDPTSNRIHGKFFWFINRQISIVCINSLVSIKKNRLVYWRNVCERTTYRGELYIMCHAKICAWMVWCVAHILGLCLYFYCLLVLVDIQKAPYL